MDKHFLLITGFSVFIIFLSVFLFFAWETATEKEEIPIIGEFPSGVKTMPLKEATPKVVQDMRESQIKSDWGIGIPKNLGFKPIFEEKEETPSSSFLDKFSSLINPYVSDFEISQPAEIGKEPIKPGAVSEEEWFKKAYPESYVGVLRETEDLMRGKGFLAESDKPFEFTSEKEINEFLYKVIDFALSEQFIDGKQAENFRHGINVVWPDIRKKERADYEKQISAFLFPLIKKAFAQQVNTGVECYRMGVSAVPVGVNLWDVCCNCGYRCNRHGCADIPDCGEGGIYCQINIGCLNAVCPWPAPAIWDPITGICGCG